MAWSLSCLVYLPFIDWKTLKEMRNSFKKWPLKLWWISNKTIMEVGNITKVATFKSFLHLSYKNTQLLFLCDSGLWYFLEAWFLGVTQKYELRVFFKGATKLETKVIFVSATKISENHHFKTAVFHNKSTLCHIKRNIYILKTKFASHK